MHGFSVNLAPELSHFSGIVPCGIAEFPVTSLDEMGIARRAAPVSIWHWSAGLEEFLFSLEGGIRREA